MPTKMNSLLSKTFAALAAFLLVLSFGLLSPKKVEAASNPIPNGWYMIVSGNSDDLVLDINSFSQSNGGNLELYNLNFGKFYTNATSKAGNCQLQKQMSIVSDSANYN